MRIAHLSTTTSGGAGRAATRSVNALNSAGVQAVLIGRDEVNRKILKPGASIAALSRATSSGLTFVQSNFIQSSDELITTFSIDLLGKDEDLRNRLNDFDLLHLHSSYNFFKLENILKQFPNKPVALTMHDERVYTGGCHYTTNCLGFLSSCEDCPKVTNYSKRFVNRAKLKNIMTFGQLQESSIHFISPSAWLQHRIQSIPIFQEIPVSIVHNCVPKVFFDRAASDFGESRFIRVGLIATDLGNPYKGFSFFFEALKHLPKEIINKIEIVLITTSQDTAQINWNGKMQLVRPRDDYDFMAALDSLTFVCVPSSSDNSPNVVIESLARGISVLASDSGGTGEIPNILGLATFSFGNFESFVKAFTLISHSPRLTVSQKEILSRLVAEEAHANSLIQIYSTLI